MNPLVRLLICCGLVGCFERGWVHAETPVGIVETQPASGRYVATDQGYMVAYTVEIPQTSAAMEMVPVAGGSVRFASDDGGSVVIEIAPFWIGKFEVTWHQYASFMGLAPTFRKQGPQQIRPEQSDAITAPTLLYDVNGRFEFATNSTCPATSLTQYAAKQYTKWLSAVVDDQYRLPSEAEWTFACLAPEDGVARLPSTAIPARELRKIAVFDRQDGGPLPVGQRGANRWGIHDLLGNVSEWVLDSDESGRGIRQLRAGTYTVNESIHAASSRFAALACGGGCWNLPADCQPTSRLVATEELWREDPDYPVSVSWLADFDRDRSIGFRVLRPLSRASEQAMQTYWLPASKELEQAVQARLEFRNAVGIARPEPISWSLLQFPFALPRSEDE